MIDLSNFQKDPVNPDRVLGWGVYHEETYHLFGFFTTKEEALTAQQRAGKGYTIAFGSNSLTGDEFIEGSSEVSA